MDHNIAAATSAAVAATLAAILPNPGSPEFPLLLGAIGGFVGTGIGTLRRQPRERLRVTAENWAFFGVGSGLSIYLFGLITGLY